MNRRTQTGSIGSYEDKWDPYSNDINGTTSPNFEVAGFDSKHLHREDNGIIRRETPVPFPNIFDTLTLPVLETPAAIVQPEIPSKDEVKSGPRHRAETPQRILAKGAIMAATKRFMPIKRP